MKIRCNRWAALAVLAMWGSQAGATEEGGLGLGGYQEPGVSQATLRGQENIHPKPGEAKPWETRPWEAAQEELRPGARKSMEERRRVGRKARKEQLEKRNMENADVQPVGNLGEQMRERPNKWRRHQMESERYYPMGMR